MRIPTSPHALILIVGDITSVLLQAGAEPVGPHHPRSFERATLTPMEIHREIGPHVALQSQGTRQVLRALEEAGAAEDVSKRYVTGRGTHIRLLPGALNLWTQQLPDYAREETLTDNDRRFLARLTPEQRAFVVQLAALQRRVVEEMRAGTVDPATSVERYKALLGDLVPDITITKEALEEVSRKQLDQQLREIYRDGEFQKACENFRQRNPDLAKRYAALPADQKIRNGFLLIIQFWALDPEGMEPIIGALLRLVRYLDLS